MMCRLSGCARSLVACMCALVFAACAGSVDQDLGSDVSAADQFDISSPLRDVVSGNDVGVATSALVTSGTSFEGVGEGFTGPAGPFTFPPCPGCGSSPADAFIAVGPQHVFQVVHPVQESTATTGFGALAVFDKGGAPIFGPVQLTSLFSGFGGACATPEPLSFVYPMVVYDQLANRWVIGYTASTDAFNGPYAYCVAVSTTGDPTGSYARYSFNFPNSLWLQRPRLGVWHDGYYLSFNQSSTTLVEGPDFCALDRARMIAGQAATKQCIHLRDPNTPGFFYSQPAQLMGPTPPPAGAPGLFLQWGNVTYLAANPTLNIFKLRVDWNNPANTRLTGPTTITPPVTDPSACFGEDYCVPQVGANAPVLDAWGHRLMYGVAYRNFGDHEALVANMTVSLAPPFGSATGIRWYEVRNPNASPVLFQTGLYGPDGAAGTATYRWLGSMAIDRLGNIGLGFFASSRSTHPGLRFTGRVPSDPAGVMSQGEAHLIDGTGSLTDPQRSAGEFGTDSSLVVDPVDDCTFWYAGQYFAVDGLNNWHTRIGSFKLPGCGTIAPGPALSALALGSASVSGGSSVGGTVTLTAAAPSSGTVVTLSSSNTAVATVPASVTVAAGATSAGFTIATSSVTASVSVTITASSGGATRTAALTVNPAAGACAAGRSRVTLSVTGLAGTVTSNPSGLNVSSGNTGSACFVRNNRVELRASRSVTWSGVTCDGGNTQTRCRFNLGSTPVSVTATLR
jgi:hypothetical protein